MIVDYFIVQKRNAITIHYSIATAKQKEWRSGTNVNHNYGNEFLDYDSITNVYFIGDVDAKDRIGSLNEFDTINLCEIRRTSVIIFEL